MMKRSGRVAAWTSPSSPAKDGGGTTGSGSAIAWAHSSPRAAQRSATPAATSRLRAVSTRRLGQLPAEPGDEGPHVGPREVGAVAVDENVADDGRASLL